MSPYSWATEIMISSTLAGNANGVTTAQTRRAASPVDEGEIMGVGAEIVGFLHVACETVIGYAPGAVPEGLVLGA